MDGVGDDAVGFVQKQGNGIAGDFVTQEDIYVDGVLGGTGEQDGEGLGEGVWLCWWVPGNC